MPGSIKVSGAQRTIAAPYVKVSGSWRTASLAYIKVAGTWRQWYAAQITDTFDRSDSSTLGTVSNGVTSWNILTGSWAIVSNTAVGTGSYALATVVNPLQVADYTLTLDTQSGTGLAFWVTDTNNWWSAVPTTTSSVSYSCPNGGTYNSSSGNCESSSSLNNAVLHFGSYACGTYTAGSSTTYGAGSSTTYTPTGEPCGSLCSRAGGTCISGGCYTSSTTSVCDGNVGRSGSGCTYTVSGSCSQGSYNVETQSCQCPNNYYTCPNGGSYNSSTGYCYYTSSYSATSTTNYSYSINVLQSTSGTVVTRASYSLTSSALSLKLVTANSTVSVQAYSAAGQIGTLTTNTFVATNPTRTATAGIIGAGIVDNFGLK